MKTESLHPSDHKSPCCDKARAGAYFLGFGGALFVMLFLAWLMYRYNKPVDANRAARAQERKKALVEMRAADADVVKGYGWAVADQKITRLPIDKAMELTVEQWKNPAAARSNLLDRAAKSVPPPPKSEYE